MRENTENELNGGANNEKIHGGIYLAKAVEAH